MLVAVLLADKSGPAAECYFAHAPQKKGAAESLSVLEQTASTLLRGPFGGVLLSAHPLLKKRVRETLNGFALQFVDVPVNAQTPQEILAAGLSAAATFRERWERARAAANARFQKPSSEKEKSGGDWAKHKQHADVKIRGLASSFDRDGVLLVPADYAEIRAEEIAASVERFARDGQAAQAHPFAQGIKDGVRGWPVLATLDGAQELSKMGASTIQDWLLKHIDRVLDLKM